MADIRLLRMEEVAQRLGISYTAVRALILYDNAIPYLKVGSRGIRVREEDFEAYIKSLEHKDKTASEEAPSREAYKGRKVLGD